MWPIRTLLVIYLNLKNFQLFFKNVVIVHVNSRWKFQCVIDLGYLKVRKWSIYLHKNINNFCEIQIKYCQTYDRTYTT